MSQIQVERLLRTPSQRRADPHSTISIAGDRVSNVERSASAAGKGLLAMPAPTNAHDHARAVKPAALGALEMPLETWLAALTGAPRIDPYLLGCIAFGRSALGGAGGVMAHYLRPQGGMNLVEEARQIARAAHDVGIRIAFAQPMRDRNYLVYGQGRADEERILQELPATERKLVRERLIPPAVPAREQIELVEEIARAIESPTVTVQFGPTAVQWCSDGLLTAIAERSAATGRRVHMHLLETRYQREWADRVYPQGIVRHLDDIGLLSPRLSLAHAVWCRYEELELLAERGVTISVNNSSNLVIKSGLAPVREMLRAGVPIAIGLDGVGLDDDDDALQELRLAWYLHQGIGLESGLDAGALMRAACDTGRRAVTGIDEPAEIQPGRLADILVLDFAALSRDVISDALDDLPLLLTRATSRHIRGLFVGGRQVIADGKLTGVDLAAMEGEVLAQLRRGMSGFNEWQRTVVRMRASLAGFYASGRHCS